LEDDWECYSSGVLEESLALLENDPSGKISAVMCRAEGEGGYGRDSSNPNLLTCWGTWGHYSFNPGLRRRSDWTAIGSFESIAKYDASRPVQAELKINDSFRDRGYRMAITKKGYFRHIGDNRHVGPIVSKPASGNSKVWLCMIVKNENHVIRESLQCTLP
jgi:hypothetical protein